MPQPTGKRKPVPLCPDLGKSKVMLNKLLTDAAMRQHGVADPYESHRKRPPPDHLDEFRTALSAKGNTPDYVALVLGRLEALAAGCGWHTLNDFSASKADEWLAQQRTSGQPPSALAADHNEFTPRETAKLLGVSTAAVRDAVKRHRLQAVGQWKARRFSRATVQALQERQGQGTGAQTRNYRSLPHAPTGGISPPRPR